MCMAWASSRGGVGDLPKGFQTFGHHGDLIEPAREAHDMLRAPHQDDVGAKIFEYTVIIITPDYLALSGCCRAGQQ